MVSVLITFLGTFIHFLDSYDLTVGTASDLLTIETDPTPVNDLSLTPSAPGCTFFPSTISFSQASPTAMFSFSCVSPGKLWVRFDVGGTDAVHYSIPDPVSVNIALSMLRYIIL